MRDKNQMFKVGVVLLILVGSSFAGVVKEVGKPVELPLVIYDEGANSDRFPFFPTGWMGDTASIAQDLRWKENVHNGNTCLRVDYTASGWWAGVAWQYPMNDWGDKPGGYDLREAKKITFWARGLEGGEKIEFKYAILGKDKRYGDSCEGKTKTIKLSTEWKQYRLSLRGDRRRIKTGFVWTIGVTDKDATFFLDDIQYE